MKFRLNKHYTGIALYVFLIIAAAILFYQGVQNFRVLAGGIKNLFGFIQPVIYGFVFAYLLNPLLRLFDDRLLTWLSRGRMRPKTRRTIGLLLIYPTMFILLFAFVAVVVPQLVQSIESLFSNVPSYLLVIENLYTQMKDYQILSQNTETLMSNISTMFLNSIEGLLEHAYESLTGLVPLLVSASAKFTTSLINIILGIIISIYFLFDREKLFAQCKKIVSAIFPRRMGDLLYDIAMDSHRVFSGFITGKLIDSLIIGILCFIIMSLMGLPYTVLISVIVGVTNIIPYFGPFIGAIPGFLIIFIVSPMQSLLFLIFILLLQQFDGNILGPKILGDITGLSALWVIFAITLFSGLFGVLGMFIGVPLFAVIYNLIKRFISFLLRRQDKSVCTGDYASEKNQLL